MSKGLNKSIIILGDLELPALPYVAPITAISGCQNIDYIKHTNHSVALWEGDLSLFKVYEGPLGYVEGPLGYAEGSPLTLCNQPYRALDTFFSKHYKLLV